jgi:Tfp pilus assembly protein PilO
MAVRARTSEKTLMIASIAVFVVLVGAFGVLCYRTNKEIKKINKETEAIKAQSRELQVKIDKLPGMEKERAELAAQMTEYEKILPDAEEIENLMTMLSEQADLSDCDVSDFSLIADRTPVGRGRGAATGAYKKVKFDCTVSSSKKRKGYYCACKFLNLLERYERFIAADNFTLRAGQDADTAMHLDLSAHTYTFTGKMAPAAAAAGRGRRGRR